MSKYRSMPSGQVWRSRAATVLGLVVDRLVEAEFVDDVRAFLGATRDADDLLRALDLRDLACGGSGRARSARDDDDVALLDMPDVGQAEIGRHTGDTQNPDGDSRWDTIRKHLHRALCFIGDHIVLPAGHAEHLLTGLVGVRAALDDLADAAAADDLADLDRRQIAGDVVHPGTDRRIDRQVTDLDQCLAALQFGQVSGFKAGGAAIHQPGRALGQDQFPILLAHMAIVGAVLSPARPRPLRRIPHHRRGAHRVNNVAPASSR